MFGDGAFRTLRVQDGTVSHWEEHVEKLFDDAKRLHISIKRPSIEDVNGLIQAKTSRKGLWRLKIIAVAKKRPEMILSAAVDGEVHFELTPYKLSSQEMRIALFDAPFHRLACKVKAISYLDQLMLLTWARERNFDEVLTRNSEGYLLEGATSNLLVKEKNSLYWIDPALPYYEGVTQALVAKRSKIIGLDVSYKRFKVDELSGKELYLCNAMKGIVPVLSIDKKELPVDRLFVEKINRVLLEPFVKGSLF